ncbi:MAG TPA: hypothetical protein VGM56_16315 [Byssovorax sp.]|jgi:hypothetical protein
MKNVALVFAGFILGGVAAVTLTGKVLADGPARVPVRFQQLCEPAASLAEANSLAGARGEQGYELVAFTGSAVCFRRVAPADPRKDDPLGY